MKLALTGWSIVKCTAIFLILYSTIQTHAPAMIILYISTSLYIAQHPSISAASGCICHIKLPTQNPDLYIFSMD